MKWKYEPKVDVLIPVYRPDRRFSRLLQMLGRQTYQVHRIIVINTEKRYWNEKGYKDVPGLEVHHLTKEEYLSQMKEMASKVTVWLLKSMLAVVIGFNTIQGILNPAVDSLKTTLFSRAVEVIPGIGNIAGSVTDVVLGSSVLIKNGIGVAALVVLVLICLVPLAKLGMLVLILELAAALIQPVSDKRMTGCVTGVGEGIRLLFRVVFTTVVLFMLTIAVVTVSVRG